jgi:predicted TIM-barrel fold metal-dependent hydrolase
MACKESADKEGMGMIIDCHAHIGQPMTGFWEPLRTGKIRDHGEVIQFFPPAFDPTASSPEVLLAHMDWAGIDRAFLVQHYYYGDQNELVLETLRRWPERFVGFAYLGRLDQPDAPDQLERLIEAGMSGLKIELGSTRRLRPNFRFDGDSEQRVWERLDQLKRPLVLDVNDGTADDNPAIMRLFADFRNLQIVVCHVGGPPREGWQERALAVKHSRGWIDISCLPLLFGHNDDYPYQRAREVIRWTVETFGVDRVMWGTDYPVTLNYGTYRQLFEYVSRHCEFLTLEESAAILGGNAARFINVLG